MLLLVLVSLTLSCSKNIDEYPVLYDNNIDNIFSNCPYYYHFAPNTFIRDGWNRKAIASESVEDVELAARLGFNFVEANIWETSDGHFVCIHGTNGTFGPEVKSINSEVITTQELRKIAISSVTLDWIKNNVRYDSEYQQYQTTIPTLEEFCMTCKQNSIGILAGVAGKREAVEICMKYLSNNIVVYGPPDDIRDYFKGYVLTWNNTSGATMKSLLRKAQFFGPPYICSLGGKVIAELEEREELDDFIQIMHRNNYLVGWASVYSREIDSMKYLKAGMDVSGSGHEVNRFDSNHDFYDLDDINHLPSSTGIMSDGTLRLSAFNTVTCGSSEVISVGKGSLSIRFKGTIRINFGSMGNSGDRYELKSDGDELFVFSDYFFHCSTVLSIDSLTDNTIISYMVYKTTLC